MKIDAALQSPTNFARAVEGLRDLDAQELPCEILECLLDSVKWIYQEQRGGGGGAKGVAVIGGDAFLDMLVYVTVRASLRRPHHKLQYVWALGDPDQLQSEGGYYLTVLESAVTFISSQAV
jgi:hypothetical protein